MIKHGESEGTGNYDSERRTFFGRMLFGIAGLTGLTGILAGLRSLSPNVLYEPSSKIKVGVPDKIQNGVTFFKEARAFVYKEKREDGKTSLHAISASCTHLGCIIQHTPGFEHKGIKVEFSCACHGSKYNIDGDVVKGPAPKPLPWFNLKLAPDDGQLIVDTSAGVKKYKSINV